jgi:cytochrome c551/c552
MLVRRRALQFLALASVVACDRPADAPPAVPTATPATAATAATDPIPAEALAGVLAVQRSGCVRCHAAPDVAELQPLGGPSLAAAARWHADDGGEAFLRRHHGGDAARDLAAWVQSLAPAAPPLQPTVASPFDFERGERLFREYACGACHAPGALQGLARRTDVASVAAFLQAPAAHRPGTVHDFGLDAGAARALATWLLREQWRDTADVLVPGFVCEVFEVKVATAGEPDLTGLQPVATRVVDVLDATPGSRPDHFVLRFQATLDVPAAGEWTFTCGSDDSSWLWIDDRLVVKNEALAPHRRARGTIALTAGTHALRVLYSEAAGEQTLEVLWRGPGIAEAPIPAARATAASRALVPPPARAAPDSAATARGRAAAAALRCASCHVVDDAELPALAAPAPATPWARLRGGPCPSAPGAEALWTAAREAAPATWNDATRLQHALQRDGCLACHRRAGRGGLAPAVRQGLPEREDLGDEGRLPPDLTGVGQRLRTSWLERVLTTGHGVRPYLAMRMPALGADLAREYAARFAAVDGAPADDAEPPFSVASVEQGQKLVGMQGRGCVTCHPFAGRKAVGPQGMDLAVQYERMRPAAFADWLLHATTLRPGTRMPHFWPRGDAADRAEVAAIRVWSSLGDGAPLPAGLPAATAGALVLEPVDRPRLHGAFLDGLSARCVAVGSPLRTHYAWDVEHCRLAWLWRGAFVDADGTWSGRAGKLLRPLGSDHVVLADLDLGPGPRRALGHRLDADGFPIWCVAVGDAEYEDHVRPRLAAGGSEVVRTLHVQRGELTVTLPPDDGRVRIAAPARHTTLRTGERLEVVYRW